MHKNEKGMRTHAYLINIVVFAFLHLMFCNFKLPGRPVCRLSEQHVSEQAFYFRVEILYLRIALVQRVGLVNHEERGQLLDVVEHEQVGVD